MLRSSLGVNEYNAFTLLPSNIFDNSSKLTTSSIKHGFIQTTVSRLTMGQVNQIAVFNISFDFGASSYIAVLKRGEVCPMPDARCPMPDARCPMPDARGSDSFFSSFHVARQPF